jgi:hypothetical protein
LARFSLAYFSGPIEPAMSVRAVASFDRAPKSAFQQADAAIQPVDATFRCRSPLSQVGGLLRLEDSQKRGLGGFQVEVGGRVHGQVPPSGLQAHLIIVNNACDGGNTQVNVVRS